MLRDMYLGEFLNKLSSASPTPGGGSVSALAGAQAAALVAMVCNLTIGKKKYADVEDEMQELLENAMIEEKELLHLVDLDAEAFDDVMDAFKLPKTNDEEKAVRREAIQRALIKATEVPLRTMEHSIEVMRMARIAAEKGNVNSISDAGVATLLASTAVEGASYNVRINLGSIKDEHFITEIQQKMDEFLDESDTLLDRVSRSLDDNM